MRQSEKRNERNRHQRSTCRSTIKAVRAAVEAGDVGAAEDLVKKAQKTIATAATKGVYHKKTAGRSISRLMQLVNKAKAPAQA